MLVLRFITKDASGSESSQEIRTPRTDVLIGSDPTADITLQGLGLAPEAVRLRIDGGHVEATVLPADTHVGRTLRVRAGDGFNVGPVWIEVLSLPEAAETTAFIFGGYEDDPALPTPRTFALADPSEPDVEAKQSTDVAAASLAVPRADAARPQAPAPTAPPASRRAAPAAPPSAPPSNIPPPSVPLPGVSAGTAAPGASTRRERKQRAISAAERAALLKRVRFEDPSFGEALVTQLKRAPFFAVSIAFHVLLFLLLMLFDTSAEETQRPDGPGALMASMNAEAEEMAVDVPELKEELGLPQLPSELPDLPEELDIEPIKPKDRPDTPSPFHEDLDFLEDREQESVDIGLMPGMNAAPRNRVPRKPKMPKVDLKQTFTKGTAGSSNQQSAEIVRAQLGSGRRGDGATLNDLKEGDVLVVGGSFDHIEKVLDMLRIKYVKKSPWSLFTPKLETFSTYKAVFWNCGESMGEQRTKAICKRLQKFVRDGGYLFTTDWGVATILPYAFPGYLKTNGNRAHLPEMVLPIQPNRAAADHPLLEGVFHPTTPGKWWLEQASFDVSVGRKDAVTVLIESSMLETTFNRSPAVAATFSYGRGRVLHAMGHYYQEAGNLAGTLSAHRLALNFVLMRLDQDREPGKRSMRR